METLITTITVLVVATIAAGTPLVFAALGELVVERSGVLNLGVEGMMIVGAVTGFIVASESGSLFVGVLAGAAAGILMSLIFAFITLTLMANQVATGLALTIFGLGLSAFIGLEYTSVALKGFRPLDIPVLSDIPFLGPLVFSFDIMIYLSLIMFIGITWFFRHSRLGLIVKAVGESPHSAHALGYSVIKVRYLTVMFGGAMSGIGGAYLSVAYTPIWVEGMTAGRGWIALALVVFASWRPTRVVIGAMLFGGVTIAQFHIQAAGVQVATEFLSMLPYLSTIIVLVIIGRGGTSVKLNTPASLGQVFHKESH